MAGIAAGAANDVGSKVALLGTVIFTVTDTTAVLANLIFVVAKRTVQRSKFAKLVALVVVLTFRGGSSLWKSDQYLGKHGKKAGRGTYRFDNPVNKTDAVIDFVLRVTHN
jgi:hypothetical protein